MSRMGEGRRGQVIVMVTVALVAMCGIMGLAVDLGWAYYVEKAAQAAADAAAIATVSKAFDTVGADPPDGAYNGYNEAPTPMGCSSVSAGGALAEGCSYAQKNGFIDNPNGRQLVTLQTGSYSLAPTVPKVGTMSFWATARVSERIPQLFSAVMGHPMGGASSRATAGVVWQTVPGSIYALDREYDWGTPSGKAGNDFFLQGGAEVEAGGDIYMASRAGFGPGAPIPPADSGRVYMASEGEGGWEMHSLTGGTFIRGTGWTTNPENFYSGDPPVATPPEHGFRDSSMFRDPLSGRGQPPPPGTDLNLQNCEIPEVKVGSETFGVITAAGAPGGVWGPGNYYAVDASMAPTGNRLLVEAGVKFGSVGSCSTSTGMDAGAFGNYQFFGGMKLPSAAVTFAPGRYVFAGVQQNGSDPGILLDGRTQAFLTDLTELGPIGPDGYPISAPNDDAGELFIFTDADYQTKTRDIVVPEPLLTSGVAERLKFGIVDLHSGSASGQTELNLHGLNRSHTALPEELKKFQPVVMWQDQRNSTVPYYYDGDGYVNCGQGTPEQNYNNCAAGKSLDDPGRTAITNGSPELNLQATPSTHLYGVVYQPRGAWVVLHGGNEQMVSPLQLISGAYEIRGSPKVILQPIGRPMYRQVVGLVE